MNNKIDYSKVLSSMRNDKFHLSVKEVNALVKEFPLWKHHLRFWCV